MIKKTTDASICDGYAKGGANRPVDGLMPCLMPKQLGREVTELEILSVTMPKNWSDWNNRFNHHINIINGFMKIISPIKYFIKYVFWNILMNPSYSIVSSMQSST